MYRSEMKADPIQAMNLQIVTALCIMDHVRVVSLHDCSGFQTCD